MYQTRSAKPWKAALTFIWSHCQDLGIHTDEWTPARFKPSTYCKSSQRLATWTGVKKKKKKKNNNNNNNNNVIISCSCCRPTRGGLEIIDFFWFSNTRVVVKLIRAQYVYGNVFIASTCFQMRFGCKLHSGSSRFVWRIGHVACPGRCRHCLQREDAGDVETAIASSLALARNQRNQASYVDKFDLAFIYYNREVIFFLNPVTFILLRSNRNIAFSDSRQP